MRRLAPFIDASGKSWTHLTPMSQPPKRAMRRQRQSTVMARPPHTEKASCLSRASTLRRARRATARVLRLTTTSSKTTRICVRRVQEAARGDRVGQESRSSSACGARPASERQEAAGPLAHGLTEPYPACFVGHGQPCKPAYPGRAPGTASAKTGKQGATGRLLLGGAILPGASGLRRCDAPVAAGKPWCWRHWQRSRVGQQRRGCTPWAH